MTILNCELLFKFINICFILEDKIQFASVLNSTASNTTAATASNATATASNATSTNSTGRKKRQAATTTLAQATTTTTAAGSGSGSGLTLQQTTDLRLFQLSQTYSGKIDCLPPSKGSALYLAIRKAKSTSYLHST